MTKDNAILSRTEFIPFYVKPFKFDDIQGIIVPKPQSATNPFYVLLVIAAMLFVMTAFAYFTMAVREAGGTAATSHGLTALLARHGVTLLIAELVLLAVATFGAIGTDDYWNRRAHGTDKDQDPSQNDQDPMTNDQ